MKKEIVNYINLWIASFKRGRQFITHDIWRIGLPGEVVPNGLIIKQIRAVILLARGLVEETLLLRASALTFATLLFLVPFLAMMFFFIQTFNLGDQVYDRMDDQLFKAVTALRNRDIEGEEEREKGEGEAQDEALIDEGEAGGPVVAPSDEAATPYLGAAIPESGDKDEVLKQQMIGLVFPILAEGHSITDDPQYTNPVKIFVGLAEEAGKSAHTVGISGLVYVLIAVFGFMRNVEYTLNRIWGVKRQRNLLLVISHYLMITFLLPFVAASILGISAALESQYIVDIMGPLDVLHARIPVCPEHEGAIALRVIGRVRGGHPVHVEFLGVSEIPNRACQLYFFLFRLCLVSVIVVLYLHQLAGVFVWLAGVLRLSERKDFRDGAAV